jgi:tRNA modification GTPase
VQQSEQDVIAAIATPPGRGGVGIVRVSGPRLDSLARALIGRDPQPRKATLAQFHDSQGGFLDEGIVLYFPAPASFTGQDVLELQGHGGPVVMQLLLKRCLDLGARLANPGEFTQRAFLNGKLDLAQAEGVADMIEASSEAALRSALRSFRGEFSSHVRTLGNELIELRMLVEAMLDFPEEELDELDRKQVEQRLAGLVKAVGGALDGAIRGVMLRAGLSVVLAGRPNVGKSSLLNCLAHDDLAIVTAVPGTTRDALHHTVIINGIPVNIIDTAGLRESGDEVERLGIVRSWKTIREADLLLFVLEADRGMTAEDVLLMEEFPDDQRRLLVFNKADLGREVATPMPFSNVVYVSAKTGDGLVELETAVLAAAGWVFGSEDVIMARERHVEALKAVKGSLEKASAAIHHPEFLAEELRMAQHDLGAITGEVTADDLLGEIFSRFCIGK